MPRSNNIRAGTVICHTAFRDIAAPLQFDAYRTAIVAECVPIGIRNQFGNNHSKPPTLQRMELNLMLDKHKFDSPLSSFARAIVWHNARRYFVALTRRLWVGI